MEEQTTTSSACPASDSNQQRTSTPSSSSRARPEPTTLASSQTSVSSSSLRFPKPEGSHLLAHWVTSSATDAMQSSAVLDETSSLADSAYELISSTDGESQDGRGTDSLAASIIGSIDVYPRADDVLSLNGHEAAYDDEEGDEEDEEDEEDEDEGDGGGQFDGFNHSSGHLSTQTRNTPGQSQLYNAARDAVEGDIEVRRSSPADSIRYAEQALCNPSTQSLSTLEYDSSHGNVGGGHSPLIQSIEFDEDTGVKAYLEKVLVKHTIREFSEGESAIIAANMGMTADAPKQLAATVRQTMSHHCLSTREPLRVLYVGSDAGHDDIMYKISSALLASASSPGSPSRDPELRHASTPGIYNIMPISAFGSAKVPEIDEIQLMGVSDYYIKVERCVKAEETVYEGEAFPNETVYSIELNSGKSHVSVFCPSGSTVSPPWTLPHVAVFYVSGNDDQQAETTRDAAWEFMTRHAVPSIFISHAQTFSRSPSAGRWQDFVDQAAVHLCLESRDPSKPIAPERLPIDLVSFLNIDARQMNRNLAYLTGLQDIPKKAQKNREVASTGTDTSSSFRSVINAAAESFRLLSQGRDYRPEVARTVRELHTLLLSHFWGFLVMAFITVFVSSSLLLYTTPLVSQAGFSPPLQTAPLKSDSAPFASSTTTSIPLINDPLTPVVPTSSVCSAPSIAPTVTISFVTTKTVEVRVSEVSSLHSQVLFGGYLTDSAHNQRGAKAVSDTEIKSTGCSIQVHSSHEILVRVPAATKTKWLAKGAIDIDVWRGQKILKSKLSTTDEGIIIEIDKKDAFGVMSVSIVTTRRPKINETFAVDFGTPTAARLFEAGLSLWQDSVRAATNTGLEAASQARKAAAAYANDHRISLPYSAQAVMGNVSSLIHSATLGLEALKMDLAKGYQRLHVDSIVGKAVEKAQPFVDGWASTDTDKLRDDVHLSVRRAQIISKLWWLRVQGKMAEHAAYEVKAAEHIRELEHAAAVRKGSDVGKDVPEGKLKTPDRQARWFW